jgi:copper resistance protein C
MTRARRRTAGLGALVAVLVLVGAVPAAAHNELVGSAPADGATVATAPAEVVLEFDQPVQTQFVQVAVLDAIDSHHERGNPRIEGTTITQVLDDLAPGPYQISYRVGSADGHPIIGTLTFTVATATTGTTPSPIPHEGHPTPSAGIGKKPGKTSALLVTGGGIAAAAVLGVVLWVVLAGRRPEETDSTATAETGQQ